MKRSFRLGLVGLAILAGSLFGVTQYSGSAQAQIAAITKACTVGMTAGTANCVITFPAGTTIPVGTAITVTSTLPGGSTFIAAGATPAGTIVAGVPAGLVVTFVPGPPGVITVICAPPAVGALVCPITTITETILGVAPGGTTTETVLLPTGTVPGAGQAPLAAPTPVVLNAVVPAAPAAPAFVTTAGVALPAGLVKVCSTAAPAPGATLTCTIAIPAGVASPITVTTTNATVTGVTITPSAAGPAGAAGTVTAGPAALGTGSTFTITCANTTAAGGAPIAAGAACPTPFTITETLVAGAGLGTPITETISTGGGVAVALVPTNAPITITAAGAAFITSITLAGCVQAATIAAPTATSILGGATAVNVINPGQQITCRLDLNDTEAGALGALVSSGIVSVTTTGLANNNGVIATIAAAGPGGAGTPNITGNTATIRCGAPNVGANTTNGCDFVDVTFTAAQTAVVGNLPATVGINATYTPDIPAQNTSAQFNGTVFTIVVGIVGFAQPTGLLFTCPSTLNTNLTSTAGNAFLNVVNGLPGQIGGVNVAGVGILPAALICQVIPTINGVAASVAPGTFEISSVNGTLLDANGNITTNLRIACGGASSNLITGGVTGGTGLGIATINPNTCTGVNFAVLGLGVGFVEIRARYEPIAIASQAGILEIEGASSVAFVAPAVNLSLTLNPSTVTAFEAGSTVVASSDPSGFSTVAGAPCLIPAAGATAPAATSCGTATLTFLGTIAVVAGQAFINPTNGAFIRNPNGSVLNGNVIFSTSDTNIARFVTATGTGAFTVGGAAATIASNTSNQVVVRCGSPFNATTFANPSNVGSSFGGFFGGCNTASATYQGVNPGQANISATFIPDLPGAFGTFGGNIAGPTNANPAFNANVFSLVNSFGGFGNVGGNGNVSTSQTLTVVASAAATTNVIQLVRGCNNVSPTISESASAYAARVSAAGILVSIFEYQPATNTFRGFSPLPGAPSDLAAVTRLRPVFVCVNAAGTLTQPAI